MTGVNVQITAEIVSLQARADQLSAANAGTEHLLTTLTQEADAARSAENAVDVQRLDRRIHLVRQRRAQVVQEMDTLLELIAARRARYGIAAPSVQLAPDPAGAGEV